MTSVGNDMVIPVAPMYGGGYGGNGGFGWGSDMWIILLVLSLSEVSEAVMVWVVLAALEASAT